MVNASLNWASIVGIVLAVGGAGLYFLRSFKPALARDYDVFFAAIGLLCGLILSKVKKCNEIVIIEPNDSRLEKSLKYLNADGFKPDSKNLYNDHFDIVFDTVGLEVTRQQSIKSVKPGGIIIHIGLTQPSGNIDFRKATLQEITFIGTYCYTNRDFEKTLNILNNKEIGDLGWIEYRNLKDGASAFKQIHDGKCAAPKIILLI